jgi:hypothetical protein
MREPKPHDVSVDAVRDAEAILERTRQDERAAEDARARYRTRGLPSIEPDDAIAADLRPNEGVVEVRQAVTVGRHRSGNQLDIHAGRLYLTTDRLILRGAAPLHVELSDIEELALAGEQLLVTLADGTGLAIDAGAPRLLRVQVSAARAASRAA